MIIQFHTPAGIVEVDSETVTDTELAGFGLTRDRFNAIIGEPDRSRTRELLSLSAAVITPPEAWELLIIFGRRLGYDF